MSLGSHCVSDIGYLPIADMDGNIYYVLRKDLCTQFRSVYRMKKKEDLRAIYRQYVTDNSWQDLQGRLYNRISNFITDDDNSFVKAEVTKINKEHFIRQWVIAPYTHNANPAEQEMRRLMEGACSNLYDSGLGPRHLMDALCAHVDTVNNMYTPVCNTKGHEFKSPYERMHGIKPHIRDMARFGCKTYVQVENYLRKKDTPHSWVGFYLGRVRNMLGFRVFRPIKNTVYDRYHCIFDCGTTYGDLMGLMYRKIIECDKLQSQYYNEEVKSILGNQDSQSVVLKLLQQLPWAIQPLPEEHVDTTPSNTTNSSAGKRSRVSIPTATRRVSSRISEQIESLATNTRIPSTPTRPSVTEHIHTPQPVGVGTLTPTSFQTPVPTAPGAPHMSPITRDEAVSLLEGVPRKSMHCMIQAVKHTYRHNELLHTMCMDDEVLDTRAEQNNIFCSLYSSLVEEIDLRDDPSNFGLLQLCEATSKRIAASVAPTSNEQVRELEGSVEHKLIVEAMTDEIMWLINEGKVIPHHKKNIKHV